MSTPDYTITISESNFMAKNAAGTIIAQNTDFGALFNTLSTIIPEGKLVGMSAGVFPLLSVVNWTRNKTTFLLDPSTIIREDPMTSSILFNIYTGSPIAPNNIVISGGILDGNNNPNMSPNWLIGGQYNIVQNAKIINAIQYALHFWCAHDGKFLSNYVNKSEYGLSTGANPVSDPTLLCTNIEMAYNIIRDSRDVGIKFRWIKDALMHDNDVDCAWLTWTTNSSGNTTEGASGIRYYQADGPTIGVVVSHNNIYDSDKSRVTVGVGVDEDAAWWANLTTIRSSGHVIINNSITDLYYGILSKFPNVKIGVDAAGNLGPNIIQRSRYAAIALYGDGCIAKGNDIYGGIVDTFGVDVQANNCQITANRIRVIAKGWGGPIRCIGTGNIFSGNLYDIPVVTSSQTTITIQTRKITTSSTPISSPLIVQGFELGVGEVFYTEQGSTLVVGAKAIAGYGISSFIVNGVSVAPNANGLIALAVEAQDYLVQAVYVSSAPTQHSLSVTSNLSGFYATVDGSQKLVPFSVTLTEGSYALAVPSNLTIGSDIYNFTQWADGSTSPTRTIQLTADTPLTVEYTKQAPPTPAKGNIEVHAFFDQQEVVTNGVVVETGETFITPTTIEEDPGNYLVRVTLTDVTKELTATVTSEQTIRLDFQFTTSTPVSPIPSIIIVLGGLIVGGVILASTQKMSRRG